MTFTEWLANHRNGLADADLADALRGLAEACIRTGKAGTMTLTFKVKPEGDMLAITDTLAVKAPTEAEARLYWVDLEGNLTRNNPMQPRLPLGDSEGALIGDGTPLLWAHAAPSPVEPLG